MIKSNLPAYSPLTASRQMNETEGDREGLNTISVSMSNTSTSAFNAHSPPYIRRDLTKGGRDDDNLDIEAIYANAERNSNTDFRGK